MAVAVAVIYREELPTSVAVPVGAVDARCVIYGHVVLPR